MHFRARSYDPRIGRFTQTDPILENRPAEHFAYGGNNSVSRVDPMGQDWTIMVNNAARSAVETAKVAAGTVGKIRGNIGPEGEGKLFKAIRSLEEQRKKKEEQLDFILLDYGKYTDKFNQQVGWTTIGEENVADLDQAIGVIRRRIKESEAKGNVPVIRKLTFIGHGHPGAISVGGGLLGRQDKSGAVTFPEGQVTQNHELTFRNLKRLYEFEDYFRPHSEVAFYSCRTGRGSKGKAFLEEAHLVTRATVSAWKGDVDYIMARPDSKRVMVTSTWGEKMEFHCSEGGETLYQVLRR